MKHFMAIASLLAVVVQAQGAVQGTKVDDFELQAPGGARVSFSSLRGPLTAVIFISTQCPVSNAYNDRMSALYSEYSGKGVTFLFINANRTESPSEVLEHAKSVGFPFPVYKDSYGQAGNLFDAQVTPEVFLIDRNRSIAYHGQIDDNRNQARVDRKTFRQALDDTLAGKPVRIAESKAFGCTIKRVNRVSR